jgi:hypothetical protein
METMVRKRFDYNLVGGVDLLDIFDFLTAWFNGC